MAKDVDSDDAKANLNAGIKLQNSTKKDFAELKKLLPSGDMQLESVADKLGLQILQCAINYYNNSDDEDAAESAMKLQKAASEIVMGEMAKDRCKENLKVLEKIIADLPPKVIRKEHDAVMAEIEKIIKKSPSISNANSLLNNCKPHIKVIKTKLGSTNEHYLKLSTIVVSVAMRMVVGDVNEAQETAHNKIEQSRYDDFRRILTIAGLKSVIQKAWEATLLMDEFDIESDFKSHYNENRNALKSMCENLDIPTSKPIVRTPSSTSRTAAAASNPKPTPSSTNSGSTSSRGSSSSSSGSSNSDDNVGCVIAIIIAIIIMIIIGLASK